METALLIVILLTGFYMAWNIGANDVANAMGTSVGSGALTLKRAVIIAAVLEFSGAFFFGSHVSKTMQSGIVNPEIFSNNPQILVFGMLAALGSAGIWLQLASYYGWPVSTTHSIVGAIIGFGAIVGGIEAVYWTNVAYIVSSWVISPLLGGILGYYIFILLRKQIFYAHNPVAATRRWTPLIVFVVSLVLALILVFEGFHNLHLELSLWVKVGLVLLLGCLGALIGYLAVQRIPPTLPIKGKSGRKWIAASHQEYATVEKVFAYLQITSACMMAFVHGANDVANAIGPLSAAVAILTTGLYAVEAPVPTWALALGGVGIVIGLATWGWRVIETIGKKITELTPSRGFSAEFAAAATIALASRLGMPVSTTHTLVGAVIGVGFARGLEAVNLTTTRDILISWVVTVPLGALLAILLFFPIKFVFG